MRCGRFILLLIALLLVGCSVAPPQAVKRKAPHEGQALVTAYLSSSGSALNSASFTIAEIALLQDGVWLELDIPEVKIDTQEGPKSQRLLGASLAPTGEHRRLRFVLKDLLVDGRPVLAEGRAEMVELALAEPLYLDSKASRCLFLNWSLDSGGGGGVELKPAFSAWGQRTQLGAGLVYVACAEIDTIYIVRADNNQVVASFSVPGPLGDMQLDQRRRRLYIISPKSRSLYVYDCSRARIIEQIFLSGTVAPEHFVLDTRRQLAYVSDAPSGQVLKLDLASGAVVARRSVGRGPEQLTLIDDTTMRLAVAAPKAQQINILGADSLTLQRSFSVGQQVTDILYFADELYVVEQASNAVAAYQYQTGKLRTRVQVGLKPQALLAVDPNLLYVGNQRSNTLSVIVPGQEISFRKIPAGLAPGALELSLRHQVIYVASRKSQTLSIVDLRGEYLRNSIEFGGRPTAVSVLD